jgi:Tle cognate immunity protein 4 C-terminal domain/Tle cognate immunity protein 4 N-terminal domain
MFLNSFKSKSFCVAASLIIFLCAIFYWYFSISQPDQKQLMTPYTQSMKTVCIGRYLIDIPASSVNLRYGQEEIDGVKVIKLPDNVSTATDYDKLVKRERAEVYKKIAEEKGMGAIFINQIQPTTKSTLYIYSLNEHQSKADRDLYEGKDTAKYMSSFIWVGKRVYKFETIFNIKDLEINQKKLISLMNSLEPWDGTTLPQSAGLCIDEAFVANGPFERGEYLSFGADIDKTQNTRISFATRGGSKLATDGVLKPMPGSTLIERSRIGEEWIKDKKGVKYQKIRQTKRVVLDQPGEEVFSRIEEKERVELQGTVDVVGGGDPKKQYYSFGIKASNTRTDQDSGVRKPLENPIQDDVAIAVWDKFVNSLRLRPGAL